MSFAILVRSPEQTTPETILAYDFDRIEQATHFARRLAWSYAEHGAGTARNVYWFRNAAGRHELKVVA